ncbi:MAG: hypothetical protein IGS48_23305 [Oscillatoriales cyanobacterium C42_A2020_001]|nr:hypothetical protein [Leptolyngbyaceae cyanobacterium C42_A2020_001]
MGKVTMVSVGTEASLAIGHPDESVECCSPGQRVLAMVVPTAIDLVTSVTRLRAAIIPTTIGGIANRAGKDLIDHCNRLATDMGFSNRLG